MDRETTVTGAVPNEPTDEELLCWQERQIAKCIVDNTVNRVVESYLTFFEDEDVNDDIVGDVFPEFQDPAVPFFEPINDRRLEESAILWAIDEHGLQQHIHHASAEYLETSSRLSTPSENSMLSQGPSNCSEMYVLSPNRSFLVDCDDDEEATTALNRDSSNDDSSSDSTSNEEETLTQIDTETPDIDEQSFTESHGSTSMATTTINDIENCINDSEHFDFMEAAVAVAIQKKGLAPYSIQLSPKR